MSIEISIPSTSSSYPTVFGGTKMPLFSLPSLPSQSQSLSIPIPPLRPQPSSSIPIEISIPSQQSLSIPIPSLSSFPSFQSQSLSISLPPLPSVSFSSGPRPTVNANSYEKYTQWEHVYHVPDMYIGSENSDTCLKWIWNPTTGKIEQKNMILCPGVERLFVEVISNVDDNNKRSWKVGVNPGHAHVTLGWNTITIRNGGIPIPIQVNTATGLYAPEMILGTFLTSSNYSGDRTESGRNGYGAKLTNVFSTHFRVEVKDAHNHLSYVQEWKNNMRDRKDPIITKYDGSENWVEITYTLDFFRFGMLKEGYVGPQYSNKRPSIHEGKEVGCYTPELLCLFLRHCLDSGFTSKVPITVTFPAELAGGSGQPITHTFQLQSIEAYAALACDGSLTKDAFITHREYEPGCVPSGLTTFPEMLDGKTGLPVYPSIEVCMVDTPDKGTLVSFANLVFTEDGGIHVKTVFEAVTTAIIDTVNDSGGSASSAAKRRLAAREKGKGGPESKEGKTPAKGRRKKNDFFNPMGPTPPTVKPGKAGKTPAQEEKVKKPLATINITDVKPHISLILSCFVTNPKWGNQSKTVLQSPAPQVHIDEEELLDKIRKAKWRLMDRLFIALEAKKTRKIMKMDSGREQFAFYHKCVDANGAGKSQALQCILIVSEGDSASSYVNWFISNLPGGKDIYGNLPLRGKVLNVMGKDVETLMLNKVLGELRHSLRLSLDMDYSIDENYATLRYGHCCIIADSDEDGRHIIALLLNFFNRYRGLIQRGFVVFLRTPILRVGNNISKDPSSSLKFYSHHQYAKWKASTPGAESYKHKYYKGLGSSGDKEVMDDASDPRFVSIYYDEHADSNLHLGFDAKLSDKRKIFIAGWREIDGIEDEKILSVSKYIHGEMGQYSVESLFRCIPHFNDGLKPGQRKVVFGAMSKWFSGTVGSGKKRQMSLKDVIAYVGSLSSFTIPTTDPSLVRLTPTPPQPHTSTLLYPSAFVGYRSKPQMIQNPTTTRAALESGFSSTTPGVYNIVVPPSPFLRPQTVKPIEVTILDVVPTDTKTTTGVEIEIVDDKTPEYMKMEGDFKDVSTLILSILSQYESMSDIDVLRLMAAGITDKKKKAKTKTGKSKSVKSDMKDLKVSQLAGYVSYSAHYKHGEGSLEETIKYMTRNYAGSNNLPYFKANGMFGTRTQEGADAASGRYPFLIPSWWFRYIYRREDDAILNHLVEEGDEIEPEFYLPIIPMHMVNGVKGIGTGHSSFMANHNPLDVTAAYKYRIRCDLSQPRGYDAYKTRDGRALQISKDTNQLILTPWYRGYEGNISVVDRKIRKRGPIILEDGTVIGDEMGDSGDGSSFVDETPMPTTLPSFTLPFPLQSTTTLPFPATTNSSLMTTKIPSFTLPSLSTSLSLSTTTSSQLTTISLPSLSLPTVPSFSVPSFVIPPATMAQSAPKEPPAIAKEVETTTWSSGAGTVTHTGTSVEIVSSLGQGRDTKKKTIKYSMIVRGKYRMVSGTAVVTEIPIGFSFLNYNRWLRELKSRKEIIGYRDLSQPNNPYFEIDGFKNPSDTNLLLVKSYGLTNMVLITGSRLDKTSCTVKYKRVYDVFESFYQMRLPYYEKRKQHILQQIEDMISSQSTKLAFIVAVWLGKIVVYRRKKASIQNDMIRLGFPKHLLSDVRLGGTSADDVLSLAREIKALQTAATSLKAISPHQMWLKDLDEFEEEYMKQYLPDGRHIEDIDPKEMSKKAKVMRIM